MSAKCCVPNCQSLAKSKFGVPANSIIIWEREIGISLSAKSKVCSAHFEKEDIIDTWVSGTGSSKYSICLKRPRLKIGAVPKLLLNKNQYNLGSIEVICDSNTKLLGNEVLMHLLILFPCIIIIQKDLDKKSYNLTNEMLTLVESKKADLNDTIMNWTSNDDSITRQNLSIRDTISELHAITRLPAAWFSDLIEIKNKAVVSFFKMGLYNKNYQRNIEKQLIVTT
ncbi:THAP-type domain-containing protein, partial [Aphis craccivora]